MIHGTGPNDLGIPITPEFDKSKELGLTDLLKDSLKRCDDELKKVRTPIFQPNVKRNCISAW